MRRSKEWQELRRKYKANRGKRGELKLPDDPYEAMLGAQRRASRSSRDGRVLPGSFESGKRR